MSVGLQLPVYQACTILMHVFVVVEASKPQPVFSSLFSCVQGFRFAAAHMRYSRIISSFGR